uniref:Uncharacterized protein n=1 Tax=Rousettus aegyptiacus TaxID=9407 RepID=A0A7J8GC41_ROUAE|nr:hypothetical protein HJG63_011747 [Rousettus aegyptiacus]
MVRVSCLAAGIRAGVLEAEVDQGQQRGCGRWTANGKQRLWFPQESATTWNLFPQEHMCKARPQPSPQTSPGARKICWAPSPCGAGRQPWRGRLRSPVAHMMPSALTFVTQL